ncbi:MAG TPA: hypothetical protein VFC76_08535 [Oscillospiraceae bacterium]|nr:hypothetical protein [Oscillospiraceae bacterium]
METNEKLLKTDIVMAFVLSGFAMVAAAAFYMWKLSFTCDLFKVPFITCIVLAAIILIVLLLLWRKHQIVKPVIYIALFAALISFGMFSNITSFSINKWNNHRRLRPFMVDAFIGESGKYKFDIDYISKERQPNFLGNYTRKEIEEIFKADKVFYSDDDIIIRYTGHDGVILSHSEKGNFDDTGVSSDTEVYYAFKSFTGTDYWLVIVYSLTGNDKFDRFTSIYIAPSGSVVTLG